MLSKGKGFGNWLRLLGRHHTRAHWTRVYDLEQGAWLDSTHAIKYILSHQGTTKPIPAEAKEAASEAPTAGPNGKPGQNDVASPERNGKAPKAAPTPSDLDWASTVWPSGTTGAARVRPINCGIAARCDAAHKKSPLEPRVRAGSGPTQATDEAALSYRALTRGGGRRGGLTRRGTPNSVKEITPFSVQVYITAPVFG